MADEISALIEASGRGDPAALQALFAHVYGELKILARKQLAGSHGHTLNTTGLVHEAYLKLSRPDQLHLHNRVHFFALAAKAMRQIVIDRARASVVEKRGGRDLHVVGLDQALELADSELRPDEMLGLDAALTRLEADEPRLSQLVELRFFAGLSISDIATLQETSERTLNRDWRRAKAYLYDALYPEA